MSNPISMGCITVKYSNEVFCSCQAGNFQVVTHNFKVFFHFFLWQFYLHGEQHHTMHSIV
jgi:hypothetical protein